MKTNLPDGIWPTMITPFTEEGKIDYDSLRQLVDWYINEGVDGLFAVCQSSEMFYLNLQEKVDLAEATVAAAAGRVPVICSGHTADSLDEQIEELQLMARTGVDALVLVSNRLADSSQGDDIFIRNLETLVDKLPREMPLGFYECPYPYKRLISPEVLEYSITSDRFSFLKDTSCDSLLMKQRLQMLQGSGFELYNANGATLSRSLAYGANGYSGVMANFHPRLYKELVNRQMQSPGSGDSLQNLLGPLSFLEDDHYPLTAKYHLKRLGILKSAYTRKHRISLPDENHRLMVEQMDALVTAYIQAPG